MDDYFLKTAMRLNDAGEPAVALRFIRDGLVKRRRPIPRPLYARIETARKGMGMPDEEWLELRELVENEQA